MCVNDCMCVVIEMKITVDDVGTGDNDDERACVDLRLDFV